MGEEIQNEFVITPKFPQQVSARRESIEKDHTDYSLNRMDDYIFDRHTFVLVQLKYLKGNQSFFYYQFIQNTYLLRILFLRHSSTIALIFLFAIIEM